MFLTPYHYLLHTVFLSSLSLSPASLLCLPPPLPYLFCTITSPHNVTKSFTSTSRSSCFSHSGTKNSVRRLRRRLLSSPAVIQGHSRHADSHNSVNFRSPETGAVFSQASAQASSQPIERQLLVAERGCVLLSSYLSYSRSFLAFSSTPLSSHTSPSPTTSACPANDVTCPLLQKPQPHPHLIASNTCFLRILSSSLLQLKHALTYFTLHSLRCSKAVFLQARVANYWLNLKFHLT